MVVVLPFTLSLYQITRNLSTPYFDDLNHSSDVLLALDLLLIVSLILLIVSFGLGSVFAIIVS